MKQFLAIFFVVVFCFSLNSLAQIPTATLVQIVKAEDERRYDNALENLLKNADEKIRTRAALAAGRIGDERAITPLVNLFKTDSSNAVRAMTMFALGEIESAKASQNIIEVLNDKNNSREVRARAVEAAGKISAANPKDEKSKALNDAILNALRLENNSNSEPNRDLIFLGLTAILRTRPEGAEEVVRPFLAFSDDRIVNNALNALARMRAKNSNRDARDLLATSVHSLVRANAERVLGAAEDKEAFDILLKSALNDSDSRVRVSAIRSLINLKDARAADALMSRAETLVKDFATMKTGVEFPKEKSEILEIFTALSRLSANSKNARAVSLIESFRTLDKFSSPETEIAYARIAPAEYLKNYRNSKQTVNWRTTSALAQGLGDLANAADENLKVQARNVLLSYFAELVENVSPAQSAEMNKSLPDLMNAVAAFKPDNLDALMQEMIAAGDVQVRATAAGILADQPANKENVEALKTAFTKALLTDKHENDAQLAMLDALFKLDKASSVGVFTIALSSPDYLVRQKAFKLLSDADLQKQFPGLPTTLENFQTKKENQVLPYAAYTGTMLGQILNTNADYVRAVSRKNNSVKAVLTTSKGSFTIDFFPEDAPLTVDNFVKLARSGYFNGVSVHRVVPNFVMQDGDPRGDGNGSPGWQIRCEINMIPYDRGAVGMALSGKDTGGSQWFVTHSPQPHLDGGYTVFGRVNETDMKIVDNIVRGDKISSVKILEINSPNKKLKGR